MSNTKRNLNDKKKHLLLLIGLTFLESKLNAAECMSTKYFFCRNTIHKRQSSSGSVRSEVETTTLENALYLGLIVIS